MLDDESPEEEGKTEDAKKAKMVQCGSMVWRTTTEGKTKANQKQNNTQMPWNLKSPFQIDPVGM
jgi:hypothetical protein